MINFGYGLHKDRQIDFDRNDRRIFRFVRSREPSIDWCMACGTCASGCTAGMSTDYSLRKLISLARRGEEDEIIRTVDRCRFCGKCINACPRGVNTRNVVYMMQLAVKKIKNNEI